MKNLTSYESHSKNDVSGSYDQIQKLGGVNEETRSAISGYTSVDVENAFRNVEDDLSDYYSLKEDSIKITLDWTLKYGSLDVVSELDHAELEFDIPGFTRHLIRSLEHDPDSKGPRFDKSEIERAISEADHKFDVFAESADFNINDVDTTIDVTQDRYSTELTVTGKLEDNYSLDLSDAKIDTDAIIERINEELLRGVARRIDFS